MSKSTVLCAVVAMLVCAMQADAAQPSAAKMSQMGLSGAQVVSDGEAMDVRGFGYRGGRKSSKSSGNRVTIYGDSKVEFEVKFQVGGADAKLELKSETGYYSKTKESASGKHLSFIGAKVDLGHDNNNGPAYLSSGGNHGGGSPQIVLFAGGHSSVKVGGHSGGHRGGGRR